MWCGAGAPARFSPQSRTVNIPPEPRTLGILVIPKRAAGGRGPALSEAEGNPLFAGGATTHVETAASAASGAKRRPETSQAPSRLLALASRTEPATPAHAFTEPLALLWRHALPTLAHASAKARAAEPSTTNAPEQDPGQCQNPNCLPERNQVPAEQPRQQPVPQTHHQLAAKECKQHDPHNRRRTHEIPSFSHIRFLTLS